MVAALLVAGFAGGIVGGMTTEVGAEPVSSSGYVPVAGIRIYDSRGPAGNAPRLATGQQFTVATGLTGRNAVAVNITLTDTVGPGYVSAWATGPWPGTSIINSSEPNENIANFAVIPVAPDGTFQVFTQQPAHIVVDLLGYYIGGSPLTPPGLTAVVTGYNPRTTITEITGTVSNGTNQTLDLRVELRCPDGTIETKTVRTVPPLETLGFQVECAGLITTGATVERVVAVPAL